MIYLARRIEILRIVACALFGVGAICAIASSQTIPTAKFSPANYGQLPMSFEANDGQVDARVRFLSRGDGYSLFLTDSEAVLSLNKPAGHGPSPSSTRPVAGDVIRMSLPGSNHSVQVTGEDRLAGTTSYFLGNDAARWHSGVTTFGRVRYEKVYPGVNLVYYGNQHQLEYDFIVSPNADTNLIRLHFDGERLLKVNEHGDLEVIAANGAMALHKPVLYQQSGSRRETVEGGFVLLAKHDVGFRVGHYDRTRQLVVDPILVYSSYLGGSGYHIPAGPDCCGDYGTAITADAAGATYITGVTGSVDFPVTTKVIQTKNGEPNTPGTVFVTRVNAAGTALIYSTYLGGMGDYSYKDAGLGIAIDAFGDAYVTGYTGSQDFPTTVGAYQRTNKAFANVARTAFVSKLSPDGTVLLYSTYLGGSGYNNGTGSDGDIGYGIALDGMGNAFIAGSTISTDFPVTPGVVQLVNNAASIHSTNGFVVKLSTDGTKLLFGTYLGGAGVSTKDYYGADYASAIAVDSAGLPYITGYVHSKNFPVTSNAFQLTNHAKNSLNATGASDTNAFATKLSSDGSYFVYSTYLGGSGNPYNGDGGAGIAVDGDGNAYIGGRAGSADFPTTHGAFQPGYIENPYVFSGFIVKLNNAGSALFYSSYLSGSGQFGVNKRSEGDAIKAVAVDSGGRAFVTGNTYANNFPVTPDAYQLHTNQSSFPSADYYAGNAFLTEVSQDGLSLVYSTYLGGSGTTDGSGGDIGNGVAVDVSGNAYLTGSTLSANFPATPGVFQGSNRAVAAGNGDSTNAFIAKIGNSTLYALLGTTTSVVSDAPTQSPGVKVTFTAYVQAVAGLPLVEGTVGFSIDGSPTVFGTLDDTQHASYSISSLTSGKHIVTATYYGDVYCASSSGTVTETTSTGTPQSITFAGLPGTATYGAAGPYLLNATSTSGLPVSYSVLGPAFLTGSLLTINGAGTLSVTASQAGNGAYSAATPITQTIVIAKATLTATAANVSRIFGTPTPSLNYSLSGYVNGDTGAVVSGIASLTTSASSGSPVGNYAITFATQGLIATNYVFLYVGGTLAVSQAPQIISFTGLPGKAVSGSAVPYLLNGSASSGLLVSYAVTGPATLTGSTLTITGSGIVMVTASQAGNSNYAAAAAVTQTIVVSPPPFVPGTVQLIATNSFTELPDGYLDTIKVTNSGSGTAHTVVLTRVSIGSATGTTLPQTLGDIAPGAYVLAYVSLPAGTGGRGARVLGQITGTFTAGSFGSSLRLTLP